MIYVNSKAHAVLKAIKENDGFPGAVPDSVRKEILNGLATVEVSPITGLDMQWKLTPVGKQELRRLNGHARYLEKNKDRPKRRDERHQSGYVRHAAVPLTIEVLDALKAIRDTGEPQTDKLEIIARIQRRGDGGPHAEFKDGVWTLTPRGLYQANNHIRKSECAQFSGKVR